MLVSVLLWLLAAMLVGAVLLAWGWRGKRLNDHPVCAQCMFDLSGCPEGTVTCPECGAGLKHPGSTRIGQRRRRPLALGLGGLLIILPAAALTAAAAAIFTGTDLNTYKPVGVLLWEARRADAARSTTIATELLSRYTAKKLSEGQVKTVMAAALDYQGDVSRPWAAEWGDLIEAGITDGKLTEDEQGRFRAQAAVLEWQIRPRVGVGDPVPILGKVKEARIGSASMLMGMMSCVSTKIGDADAPQSAPLHWDVPGDFRAITSQQQHLGWVQLNGQKSRMGSVGYVGDVMLLLDSKGVRPGRHKAKVVISMETKPQAAMQTINWNPLALAKQAPDIRRHEAEIEFEIVAAPAGGVELVRPTPELHEKMERQLYLMQVYANTYSVSSRPAINPDSRMGEQTTGQAHFNLDGSPMDVAFDVIWKAGDKEWPIGTFTSGISTDSASHNVIFFGPGREKSRYVSSLLTGFNADKVDVILRPNRAAALRTLDVERIYGGEIVYKNVDVADANSGSGGWRVSGSGTTRTSTQGQSSSESKAEPAKSGPGLMRSIYDAVRLRR